MSPLHIFVTLVAISTTIARAQVPPDKTFRFVNKGEFGDRVSEYDASYRVIRNDNYNFLAYPFRLCFYNTTPSAYIFAIRAGVPGKPLMRWVWDANRRNPVGENSVLSFGTDGNLVLAESDGRVKWQTNTANKGVTGIQMLPTGNLVLHDKMGRFVWQSFDHPTDTLLTGQSLSLGTGKVNKLVSRTSDTDNSDGPYSMVLEQKGLIMYVNKTGQPLIYGGWQNTEFHGSVTFDVEPENENNTAYELILRVGEPQAMPPAGNGRRRLLQFRPIGGGRTLNLNKVNYNATISFLRLGSDGGLRAFTYYDYVEYENWEETFAFFSTYFVRKCGLPSFCGDYGFCDKGMCIACPTPKGLLGWSESCAPPKTTTFCGTKGKKVNYYKIVGVEHFLGPYLDDGEGPIKVNECRAKCDRDCKCLGFFYKENTSKCFLAPLLGTLIKDVNTSSVGYIKY